MKQGLMHVYCGDGKGKTTAAMGLALRAAGGGLRVHVVQFLKSGTSGELAVLRTLPNVKVFSGKGSTKFSFQMSAEEKAAATVQHNKNLRAALSEPCDVLILDEAASAYRLGLVDTALIEEIVHHRAAQTELVITGRQPAQFMLDAADYVTEMVCRKHPYEQGIAARKGIEF